MDVPRDHALAMKDRPAHALVKASATVAPPQVRVAVIANVQRVAHAHVPRVSAIALNANVRNKTADAHLEPNAAAQRRAVRANIANALKKLSVHIRLRIADVHKDRHALVQKISVAAHIASVQAHPNVRDTQRTVDAPKDRHAPVQRMDAIVLIAHRKNVVNFYLFN